MVACRYESCRLLTVAMMGSRGPRTSEVIKSPSRRSEVIEDEERESSVVMPDMGVSWCVIDASHK